MYKKRTVSKLVLAVIIYSSLMISCMSNAGVALHNNTTGNFYFQTSITENLDSTMRAFSGADDSQILFSKSIIEAFFVHAGFTLTSIDNSNPTDIEVSGETTNLSQFSKLQPISLTIDENENTFTIQLDEKIIADFIALLDEESLSYVDLLQAPLFTREAMSTEEYIEFIAALYGQTMSNDLLNSFITFQVQTPEPIKNVITKPESLSQISYTGSKANFIISLAALLSNYTEATLQIIW